jgi:two-component system nitrate/nitrite response regulator NarL
MGSQLLAESLARNPRFEIAGISDTADLPSQAASGEADVAVIGVDTDRTTTKGLQVARVLKANHPGLHIVVLLEFSMRESVIAAFRCGATGVFCRAEPLSELVACIERVSRGEIWASGNHTEYLLEAFRRTPSCEGIAGDAIRSLSDRELQVAECAAQGQSNKQIADHLGLSEHTIKNYLFRIFEKLGVSNRFELLFLLFKECNTRTPGLAGLPLGAEPGHSIETYIKAAEEGSITAQFVVGLAHLEGYGVEQDGLSAYYWLRLAEENSSEFGLRSRALLDQVRNIVKANEVDGLEHRVAIAVKNNKLLKSRRPVEFVKRKVSSSSLRMAV